MRVLTASDRAVLVEAADLAEAMRLNQAWEHVPGVIERVPGARTVLVRFDPLRTSADELAARLEVTRGQDGPTAPVRDVVVPVHYDGEDLAAVAEHLGVSTEQLIARHLAAVWRVACAGCTQAMATDASTTNAPVIVVHARWPLGPRAR